MFVYWGDETVTGHAFTHKEYFKKVSNQLTELLSTYTADGLCYRVDLRLRPDGRYGEVCHSLEGAKQYYANRARDWELQMLIKARVAAGDLGPGRDLLAFTEPLIYSSTLDFKAVESVSEARQRIHEKLKRSRQTGLNIKLAHGGIRDIEFLVQCLQRLHGGRDAWVRQGGTMMALFRLRDKDFLSDREYSRLMSAYQFLRNLEHRLQFLEDRQTHNLPTEMEQLDLLARKMPEGAGSYQASASSLERDLDEHFSAVRELYERVIHAQRIRYSAALLDGPSNVSQVLVPPLLTGKPNHGGFPSANLARFLEQRTPRFMERLRDAALTRGQERFEHFLEKVAADAAHLRALEGDAELAKATIDFFEHSGYFSDQLIRYPDLLAEIAQAVGTKQGRVGFQAPHEVGALRRFFREQMVRIQSDSVYHGVNVYKTLKRTSDLAESVVRAAYQIALDETLESSPPVNRSYRPSAQMMVIALGRLGMREFDLASDADLVFLLPDEDAPEIAFWTSVAERIIHVISAYTGDGVIFTVDTRLRPNGREGDLVQTESFYNTYFAQHAEAWEGIAHMKARAVAGDIEHATSFLNSLQEVDWRRYGQSGRSRRQLADMRLKIEKEQGTRNPLKAGPGGYYDIDFALLYLRLKGAGIFYKVLNTPARIDIIEKMGHLDREDAEFFTRCGHLLPCHRSWFTGFDRPRGGFPPDRAGATRRALRTGGAMVAGASEAEWDGCPAARNAGPGARPNPQLLQPDFRLTAYVTIRAVKLLSLLAVGLLAGSLPAAATPGPRFQPALDQAFTRLYSSDFSGAQSTLDQYSLAHPSDPVAYSVKAAGYLFAELERLGILEADFFQDDSKIADKKKLLKPDPKVRDSFYAAVNKAQSVANSALAINAEDTNALFAKCLALGSLTDYMALIEKKQMQSLSTNKEGYRDAKRLLKIAPDFYDANLTTGFTEYLIGSIPLVVRWFVRFDDVQGDKKQGVNNLKIVAEKGHYLRPFAKILLATAYLRDKKPGEAQKLLKELNGTYPQNALLKRELDRLSAKL